MNIVRVLVAALLSFCATAIMSYISMATPIGPWIETTLVLAAMLIFSFLSRGNSAEYTKSIGLTTIAGGIGGILATGVGFSFPTLYFIDKATFQSWLAQPLYFSGALGALCLAAGSFGLVTAQLVEKKFIEKEALPFPIGELIYKMISAQNQLHKAVRLAAGFLGTLVFLIMETYTTLIPHVVKLVPQKIVLKGGFTIPSLSFSLDLFPMFAAVGFITGHVIALPLLVGLAAKFFVIDPLHHFYPSIYSFIQSNLSFLPSFTSLSEMDFITAFSSGIVLYGAFVGIMELPKMLYTYGNKVYLGKAHLEKVVSRTGEQAPFAAFLKSVSWPLVILTLIFNSIVMVYFQFSFQAQLYLLIFTFICSYQMAYIAGKIGLAPLGRFATFVLVPSLFLFNLNAVQITYIATFVEIAGGVTCDALFGRKMASLASFEHKKTVWYQWLGLVISCLSIGIVCWILISHFGLGSEQGSLAVSRAVNRALLINCKNFDFGVLGLGFLFGYLLTFTRVSPVLVLGGILMQPTLSLMLIFGGFLALLVKDKEEYYPIWSGVFASNSLWMIIKALIK